MESIFPIHGFTPKETLLLFCLEKEIIKRDLAHSKLNDDTDIYLCKNAWFVEWRNIVDNTIRKSAQDESISIEHFDKDSLYNEIVSPSNISLKTPQWEKKVFSCCQNFVPYNPQDLIKTGKCSNDWVVYESRNVLPILKQDFQIKETVLKEIAIFLNHYNLKNNIYSINP